MSPENRVMQSSSTVSRAGMYVHVQSRRQCDEWRAPSASVEAYFPIYIRIHRYKTCTYELAIQIYACQKLSQ